MIRPPTGIFSLSGDAIRNGILTNPNVDGVSISVKWKDLQDRQGHFIWTNLDALVNAVTAAGKKILLRITTMGGKASLGGSTPDWVFSLVGNHTISYIDGGTGLPLTIPLFWNTAYLDQKKAMIIAVGDRYHNNPNIVVVGTSFANAQTEDWGIPDGKTVDGVAPTGSTESSRMIDAGYTHDKLVGAGKQIINTTAAAWPGRIMYTAIGAISSGLEVDKNAVVREVRDAVRARWGADRIYYGRDSISNKMPVAPPDAGGALALFYDSNPYIAGQNLWRCYQDSDYRMNGGTAGGLTDDEILHGSIDKFMTYGAKWLEEYEVDILNLPDATHYGHLNIGA